jgi:hypothetical protein
MPYRIILPGEKTMSKVIKIACKGAGTLPLEKFVELQGELKTLLKEDFEKLKKEILERGFSFTPNVWFDQLNAVCYILDGHQRLRVIRHLVEQEGYTCPPIPYSETFAETYQQAKEKLLSAASQYGRVQNDGLLAYVQDMEMPPEEMQERYRFADLSIKKFLEANYDPEPTPETRMVQFEVNTKNTEVSEDDFSDFEHKCPRCSFEFNS